MSDSPADPFRCLDLPPDASPSQVERAYRRKQALYGDGVLATYCLLEEGTRREMLERFDAAYRQIAAIGRNSPPAALPAATLAATPLPAEPEGRPGLFLQARRQAAGLSLQEIALRTKISPMQLRQIEEERYGVLPAAVYLRGFVIAYARAVGVANADGVAKAFLARQREEVAEG